MAVSFNRNTPVLYYQPTRNERYARQHFVMWPAFRYRVIAPQMRSRELNILQKAVLGLCMAGVTEPRQMAVHLQVDAELMQHVCLELLDLRAIDPRFGLTQRGLEWLTEERLGTPDFVGGHVFQEAWSRELFPRFVDRLSYAEVDFDSSQWPQLILGTTGKPRRHNVLVMWPDQRVVPSQPGPQAILDVCRRHARAHRGRDLDDAEAEDWGRMIARSPRLGQVSFIEEDAEAVFVATTIYVPENDPDGMCWTAYDPFGLGECQWTRRLIERHMSENHQLKSHIMHLLDIPKADRQAFDEMLQLAQEQATLKVEERLTLHIRQAGYYQELVAMERAFLESDLGSVGREDRLKTVMGKAQIVLERFFKLLFDMSSNAHLLVSLRDRDKSHNAAILNGVAAALGFDSPLPQSLTAVQKGKIQSFVRYRTGSLNAHLLGTLLAAHADPDHPFRQAARRMPDLLHRAHALARVRDEASHATNLKLDKDEVQHHIETVYAVIESLQGTLAFATEV